MIIFILSHTFTIEIFNQNELEYIEMVKKTDKIFLKPSKDVNRWNKN